MPNFIDHLRAFVGHEIASCVKSRRSILAAAFCVFLVIAADVGAGTSLQNTLQNPGFEEGLSGWTVSAVEQAVVTDGDDGSDYEVYADVGISVEPLTGERSLLLGTPGTPSGRQLRGENKVLSEPFVTTDGRLTFTIRVFSYEFRGDDAVFFSFISLAGENLSKTGYAFSQTGAVSNAQPLSAATKLCKTGANCVMTIDIGRSDALLFDSGIYEVTVSGLPIDSPLRFEAGVLSGENSSKATWMYLDNAAQPPEAIIRVNPGDTPDLPALEGDFVVADCLQSSGDGIDCAWKATGGGWTTPRTATGDIAFFWFPDEDPVVIDLTVTDANGLTATASKALNIVNAEPVVNAINVEVLAGATGETICRYLDAGIGQFDDDGLVPGQEEAHFLAGGVELEARQESEPSFTSGFFRIAVSPGAGLCQIVDVDGAVGSDAFEVVTVAVDDLSHRLGDQDRTAGVGGNDGIDTAYPLEVDWTYLGAISDPQDIDVFRVVRDGSPLPAGSELIVTLAGQPADYDLLVFSNGGSTEASPFFNAPFFNAPFFNAPFFNAPFFNAPFFNAQFDSVPFFNAPFFNAPFFNAPFFNAPVKKSPFFNAGGDGGVFNRAFTELPLSEVGLAAPDGSNVSGSDVSVSEVGSFSLRELQATPGISLKAMSAEPGRNTEKVLVRINPGETEIYVAVVGSDLAFSATQPYSLTLEASSPPSQEALLAGTGFCDGERAEPSVPVDPGDASTYLYGPTWSATGTGSVTAGTVLILTQKERYQVEQHATALAAVASDQASDVDSYWASFWSKVDEYAAAVGGTVVSVDGGLFEAADRNPCSVATRNVLVTAIRDTYIVDQTGPGWRNGSLDSVVIVGGQNVIPPLAVPDETVVGNERDFVTDLWVRPGTPLGVATAEGYNLTDAVYVDLVPTPFRGRALYLEDRPVARLVERPAEIVGDIDAFLATRSGAAANAGRIAVGYDFFCDGTAEVAEILGVEPRNGPPCDPTGAWSAEDLENDWFKGGGEACAAADFIPLEIANVNAHMTTYAALSALGFEEGLATGRYDDVLGADRVEQCLAGTLTTTIGCHSGLNIPDNWALDAELNLPFDPARDWVESLGHMVAPRGYGLGDNTVSNRGTEGIMILLMEELAKGAELGDALVRAKRRYVMGLREIDVHDEDSLINLALFAPPQLTFVMGPMASTSANALSSIAGTLALTVTENAADGTESYLVGSASGPDVFDLMRFDDANMRGSWFEVAPGDAQATYGRSLQPVTIPVEDRTVGPGETRIHGVALVSRRPAHVNCPVDVARPCNVAATYRDLEDVDANGLYDFNPVFPLPQHDWVVYEDDLNIGSLLEPDLCVEALAPTQLGVASTLDTGERVSQSLVVGAGQFRCEGRESRADAPDQVVGQQRLYSGLELSALHPVGTNAGEALAADQDFDPPQVTVQSVLSDPETGDVTAIVGATDALTGGNGIREIIALVYWDEGDTPDGVPGIIESYSATPDSSASAEPFGHTFILKNAREQRVAFQYIDGAGNLTVKSQKGALIRSIDVQIIETRIDLVSPTSVSIFVESFCSLEAPTVSYSLDGTEIQSFTLDDPPAGATISIEELAGDGASCDATLTIEGLDLGLASYGETAELTIEVRAPGAIGADTEIIRTPALIQIQLPVLPSGTVSVDYPDQVFTATGGIGGYTWSISGGALPPALILTQVDGVATLGGDLTAFVGSPFTFTVTVTDAGGVSASVDVSIAVAPPPLVIGTSALPDARVGDPYEAVLTASGGSGVATWAMTGGELPPGLSLSGDGRIAGVPTDFSGSPYTFSATLTDASPDVVPASVALTVNVAPPPLVVNTSTLPDGRVGDPYSSILSATGGSGTASWSLSSGVLPPGLTLDAGGTLSGTPTDFSGSPYTFAATLTDASPEVPPATVALDIKIIPPPLVITTAALPGGDAGDAYFAVLEASGGSGSATWSVTQGSLPPGLQLSPDGSITGTLLDFVDSPYTFSVTATDDDADVLPVSAAFSIAVMPAGISDLTPTGNECDAFLAGTADPLVLTTNSSGGINPGRFFYYNRLRATDDIALQVAVSGTSSMLPEADGVKVYIVDGKGGCSHITNRPGVSASIVDNQAGIAVSGPVLRKSVDNTLIFRVEYSPPDGVPGTRFTFTTTFAGVRGLQESIVVQ